MIFSGPMVRAILAGAKTQTRRIAKPPAKAVFLPDDLWENDLDEPGTAYLDDESGRLRIACPYGVPGDRLWLKETWFPWPNGGEHPNWSIDSIVYRAENEGLSPMVGCSLGKRIRPPHAFVGTIKSGWHSGRFMPRWASRITLEITDIRVERLTKISSEDAQAEGFADYPAFLDAFYALNKGRITYADDPWVWALSFRRIEGAAQPAGRTP